MSTGWHEPQYYEGHRSWTWVDAEAQKRAGRALAKSEVGRRHRLSERMAEALLCLVDEERSEAVSMWFQSQTLWALRDRGLANGGTRIGVTEEGREVASGYNIDGDYRPTKGEVDEVDRAAYERWKAREAERDTRCYVAQAQCGCTVAFASIDVSGVDKHLSEWARRGYVIELVGQDEMRERMSAGVDCTHGEASA